MNVARGLVLVKPVDTDETLGGGRILIPLRSRETMTAHQMIVVDVGASAWCEDYEDCQRTEHIPGYGVGVYFHPVSPLVIVAAWVLIRHRSLVSAGVPGEKLYFVKQDDVLAVFVVAP